MHLVFHVAAGGLRDDVEVYQVGGRCVTVHVYMCRCRLQVACVTTSKCIEWVGGVCDVHVYMCRCRLQVACVTTSKCIE